MSRKIIVLAIAATAVGLALSVAGPAWAEPSDIGKNVGDELQSWAKGLLLAVAALVALPALAKRDVSQGLVIVLLVVIVGGFVYATTPVQNTISTMWNTVAGSAEKGGK